MTRLLWPAFLGVAALLGCTTAGGPSAPVEAEPPAAGEDGDASAETAPPAGTSELPAEDGEGTAATGSREASKEAEPADAGGEWSLLPLVSSDLVRAEGGGYRLIVTCRAAEGRTVRVRPRPGTEPSPFAEYEVVGRGGDPAGPGAVERRIALDLEVPERTVSVHVHGTDARGNEATQPLAFPPPPEEEEAGEGGSSSETEEGDAAAGEG